MMMMMMNAVSAKINLLAVICCVKPTRVVMCTA